MNDIIEERKKRIIERFNLKKNWYWFVLAFIAGLGYWIRTRNLGLLVDSTTGKYYPMALDPDAFLRYVKYIYENGFLMDIDYMRYYPWGFDNLADFRFLSNFIVYLHKFISFFNPAMEIEKTHVLYPAIAFVFGLIFFFLLVKKLFNYRIALLSSFLLATIPAFLPRTIAGFSDKESLAITFMFIAFYLFVSAWKCKDIKKTVILGSLSGIFTAFMGMIWGGVTFAIVIIAVFSLVNFVLIKFRKRHFYIYSSWIFFFLSLMLISQRYIPSGIIGTLDTALALFVFVVGLINFVLFKKNLFRVGEKIKKKLPAGVASLLIAVILIIPIISRLESIFITLTNPFGQSRWALTVAEAHQPYLIDTISDMGWKMFVLVILGTLLLFYDTTKHFDKKFKFNIAFAIFLFGFVFNRYRGNAAYLNGETLFALFIYLGFIILFGLFIFIAYIYSYHKNKELFKNFKKIKLNNLFIIIWFLVMVVAVRGANRLIFVFPVVSTILISYSAFRIFDYSKEIKDKNHVKFGLWVVLFMLFLNPISISDSWSEGNGFKEFTKNFFDKGSILSYPERATAQARVSGSHYNVQWQNAGKWIRENTPKPVITNAVNENGKREMRYDGPVFAHWWDYGYLVQSGGQRATVTDGGNAKGSLNHMMGRHFLMGQNETEALEFFKAHNVTHALIISDEIGKYPAFSSIGSDENWDRYSWINVFGKDNRQTKENRDGIIYVYVGGTPLDYDFMYKGKLYPKSISGIVAFILPVRQNESSIDFGQPSAIMVYNGQQENIPIECLFIDGREVTFPEEGLKGCFVMIPRIDSNNIDPLGNGLYISEKVRKTLFYKLYLTSQDSKYFKLVYNDEQNMPLSVYNGRIIGPLKIWEIQYPKDLVVPEIYYSDVLPNPKVNSVSGRY